MPVDGVQQELLLVENTAGLVLEDIGRGGERSNRAFGKSRIKRAGKRCIDIAGPQKVNASESGCRCGKREPRPQLPFQSKRRAHCVRRPKIARQPDSGLRRCKPTQKIRGRYLRKQIEYGIVGNEVLPLTNSIQLSRPQNDAFRNPVVKHTDAASYNGSRGCFAAADSPREPGPRREVLLTRNSAL